jgi:small subunit ribosomal protein S22
MALCKVRDIGKVFMQDNVQNLLRDITRYRPERIFRRRQVRQLKTPKMMLMSNEQLERAKEEAYSHAKARTQMPPVMSVNDSQPITLACDEEIVGYTKFRVMFIDISIGSSDRDRLMSVREKDGRLREPTHEERSRLNHIFYPGEGRSVDTPKMFEEKRIMDLCRRKEYEFILNRACIQFEPDDPRYVAITSKVYDYIDKVGDYDMLRSTRHFGPMSLYLARNKKTNGLINDMITRNLIEDAVKLVRIGYECHRVG